MARKFLRSILKTFLFREQLCDFFCTLLLQPEKKSKVSCHCLSLFDYELCCASLKVWL